jgi:2-polyprenyl-3-methyl-5-hydroxy-6-metoxy-1,4-benzoquinol methylase
MKNHEKQQCRKTLYRLYLRIGLIPALYTYFRLLTAPLLEIEKYVPKSGSILDIGYGSGIFANLLCFMSHEWSVTGFDISLRRINLARKSALCPERQSFQHQDANEISHKLGSFYVITVVDLLHHIPYQEQESLLYKIHSALSVPGLLVLKDFEKNPLGSIFSTTLKTPYPIARGCSFAAVRECKSFAGMQASKSQRYP